MIKKNSFYEGPERRRTGRREILESFSFSVMLPKKGDYRLPVYDVSELGMAFDLDMEGEELSQFPVSAGETLDLNFYLNQTLYIPLSVRIVRIHEIEGKRKIGSEMAETESKYYQAYCSFVELLDKIIGALRIQKKS